LIGTGDLATVVKVTGFLFVSCLDQGQAIMLALLGFGVPATDPTAPAAAVESDKKAVLAAVADPGQQTAKDLVETKLLDHPKKVSTATTIDARAIVTAYRAAVEEGCCSGNNDAQAVVSLRAHQPALRRWFDEQLAALCVGAHVWHRIYDPLHHNGDDVWCRYRVTDVAHRGRRGKVLLERATQIAFAPVDTVACWSDKDDWSRSYSVPAVIPSATGDETERTLIRALLWDHELVVFSPADA